MKARRVLCAALLVAISLSFPVLAQSASDVLRAFRKLEASTEAGVNRNEYARGMANVNAELKSFSDANSGQPEAIGAMRAAFAHYQRAATIWDSEQELTFRYQQGEVSIKDYFDRKRANITDINDIWRAAAAETDRAAALIRAPEAKSAKKKR